MALKAGSWIHISSVSLCHLGSLCRPVFCNTFCKIVPPFFAAPIENRKACVRNGRQSLDYTVRQKDRAI
jgi:hypothetical protein